MDIDRLATMLREEKVPLSQFSWWNSINSHLCQGNLLAEPTMMILNPILSEEAIKSRLAGHSRSVLMESPMSINGQGKQSKWTRQKTNRNDQVANDPIAGLHTTNTLIDEEKRWNRTAFRQHVVYPICVRQMQKDEKERAKRCNNCDGENKNGANKQKKSENGQKLTINRIATN